MSETGQSDHEVSFVLYVRNDTSQNEILDETDDCEPNDVETDKSDDDVYQSDEEIKSILNGCSGSSSTETLDEIDDNRFHRRDSGRGSFDLTETQTIRASLTSLYPRKDDINTKPLVPSILPSVTIQKIPLRSAAPIQIFPLVIKYEIIKSHPMIIERLENLIKPSGGVVYLSFSFMKEWDLSYEIQPDIVCDACVFSYTRPVRLLTIHKSGKNETVLHYNAKLARHLNTKIRKHLFTMFSVISGVISVSDYQMEPIFTSKMQILETEAKSRCIPKSLYMDESRCDEIVDYFLKLSSCERSSGKRNRNVLTVPHMAPEGTSGTRRKGSMPMVMPSDASRQISMATEKTVERSSTLPGCDTILKGKRQKSPSIKTKFMKFLRESERKFDKYISGWEKPRWLCNHDWRRVNSDNVHKTHRTKRESSRGGFESRVRKAHRRTQSMG